MSLVDVRISATSQYGQLSEQIGGLDKRLRVIERGGLTVSGGGSGGTVSDATTLLKGKLRLGNYLGGTANDPTVNRVTDVTGEQLKAFHGLAGGPSGAQWQLSQGTIASPYAIALPSLVVQRTQEISSPSTTTPYGGPADPQWYSSIVGIARGNAGDNTMVSGLVGAGHQYSTTAAASPPGSNAQDAAGLWAIGAHHGIGAGFGAYIEGRIDATSGTPGVGARCRGIEVRTSNYEAVPTDSPYVPASITNNKMNGIQLSALVYNDSTKLVGTGIVFYRPNAGAGTPRYGQFDVGIGVTAYEDPIRNAFIRDDGTSVNSILVNGTHTGGAIKIADGAGDLIAGDDFKLKGPRPYIDVTHPDYGAIRDSTATGWSTSDLGAILQAVHDDLPAAGGIIWIPEGYYRMVTGVWITKPVKIWAAGCGTYNNAADTSYWNPQTKIRWQNATDAAFFVDNVFGVEISGFFIDGANVATLGFDLKAASWGTYKNLAFGFFGTNTATNTGTAFRLRSLLDSEFVSGASNVAHNHFEMIGGSAPVPILYEMIGGCGRAGESRLPALMGTGSITTITLTEDAGDAGFSSLGGTVQIDSEKFFYTGISGNDLTGVTRAQLSTTAASHTANAVVYTPASTKANVCLNTFTHVMPIFGTTNGTQSAFICHDTDNNHFTHIHAYRVTPGPPGTEYAYSWQFATTSVNTTDGTLTIGSNDLVVGDRVRFITNGSRVPYGFVPTASYYVVEIGGSGSGEWIKLSLTSGGAPIVPTDQGAGTLRVRRGGFTFEFRGPSRENYAYHVECNGGVLCYAGLGASANNHNTISGYDMGNGEPEPDIMGVGTPRLTWTTEGRLGTGWRVNTDSSDPILGSSLVRHHFGGRTFTELVSKATSLNDSNQAWLVATMRSATFAPTTGYLGVTLTAVLIGSHTDHIVVFRKFGSEVFRLDSTGQVQLAAGKRLYGGDGIVVKVDTPIDDTKFVVPTNGMVAIDSATDTLKYRSNGNWFSAGGAFTPTTPFTVTGTTLSEIIAEATSNSSDAYLETKARTSGGTLVHGQIRSALGGSFIISATSLHPIKFFVQGTESFQVTTSRHIFVQAGNKVGIGVASPAAALDFAADLTAAGGILFGETEFFRHAAETLKLQAATGGGLAVTPSTTASPISAGAQGVFINATGIIDINRTAGANNAAIRIYAATNPTETSPRLRIDGDGTFLWSADGTTRTVRLKPTAAQTLSLEGSADGTTWTTAPILRFPTAASTILFEAGGILQCSATGGLKIGSASSDYVSFFGATPKQRPSGMTTRVSAITDSTTGTPATSIGAPPVFYSTDGNYLENALASILTLLNNNKTRIDELSDRVNENATTGLGLISGTA